MKRTVIVLLCTWLLALTLVGLWDKHRVQSRLLEAERKLEFLDKQVKLQNWVVETIQDAEPKRPVPPKHKFTEKRRWLGDILKGEFNTDAEEWYSMMPNK